MTRLPRCLLSIALCLLIVGCSSAPRTVLVTLPAPLACRIPCPPMPTEPPVNSDKLDDWLMWGDDVSEDYLQCERMHADCVSASEKQATENAD